MPIATDVEALLDALAAAPEDWPAYGVASDALEESGDPEGAACLRWAAREGRRASFHAGTRTWDWWDEAVFASHRDRDLLPPPLFVSLGGPPGSPGLDRWEYPSARAALDALLAAWRAAVAGGWRPEGEEVAT